MRPHQLKALIAAADHGSIRAAARSVFLSQGALTKALKELEGEVQVALITRSTHGIQLTEAGRLLYARASAIDAQMTAARDAVDRLKGESVGSLRAAISPLTAVTFLPSAYAAFRRRMPDVDVRLVEGNLLLSLPRLREGSLDFVVAGALEMQPWGDLAHTELCTDKMVLVCRRGHPLEHVRAIEDLLPVDWLWYSDDTDCAELERQTFARNGVPSSKRAVRCSSMTLVFSMLFNTDAIAFLPRRMLEPAWLRSMLTCLHIPFYLPIFRLQIFTRRHALLGEPAQLLIDCLFDAVRRGDGEGFDAAWPIAAQGKTTH